MAAKMAVRQWTMTGMKWSGFGGEEIGWWWCRRALDGAKMRRCFQTPLAILYSLSFLPLFSLSFLLLFFIFSPCFLPLHPSSPLFNTLNTGTKNRYIIWSDVGRTRRTRVTKSVIMIAVGFLFLYFLYMCVSACVCIFLVSVCECVVLAGRSLWWWWGEGGGGRSGGGGAVAHLPLFPTAERDAPSPSGRLWRAVTRWR